MNIQQHENLGNIDRTMRIITGIALCLSILIMPFGAAWIAAIAFASMYPLLTGLIAIDPFLTIIESIKIKPVLVKTAPSSNHAVQ